MICPKCGAEIEDGLEICSACGESLKTGIIGVCHKCGEEIPVGAEVCPNCGEPVAIDKNNNYFNAKTFGIVSLVLSSVAAALLIAWVIVIAVSTFSIVSWIILGLSVGLLIAGFIVANKGVGRANKNPNREYLALSKIALMIASFVLAVAIFLVILFLILLGLKSCASCY